MPGDFDSFWAEAAEGFPDSADSDSADGIVSDVEAVEEDNPDVGSSDSNQVDEDSEIDADNPDGIGSESVEDDFDWSAYADRPVPIVVDGETLLVPLGELRNGYMRQSAWTKRTQQLAEAEKDAQWAREVRQAIQADPVGVLKDMAAALRVRPEELLGEDPFADVDEDLRPIVQQNQLLQQQLEFLQEQLTGFTQAQQQERMVEQVKREVEALQADYGEDFDARATIQYAATYNIPLDRAAAIVFGEKMRLKAESSKAAATQASQLAESQRAKAEAERAAAKKRASTGGPSYKVSEVPSDDFEDIGQLMELLMAGSGR